MATGKLSKLTIFSASGIQMRTFHITWLTFFVCFFGWFGIAPLMPIIREDLHLTKPQIGNAIIAAVSITVFARLIVGRLCDTIGPRITYTGLLVLGAIPVLGIGLSHSYESFLWFRLAIGVIGASFVITQFHTSAMFADTIKGTANAVAGGWGNLGGGVTNMVMPLILGAFVAAGYTKPEAWRLAMLVPGVMLLVMAVVYYRFTKDTPEGNYAEINRSNTVDANPVSFGKAAADWRVWALFLAYGACFGIEITFDGVAALYFTDTFKLDLATAGLLAGIFGFMNIFARALGGIVADKVGVKHGMRGKGILLATMLLLEGLGIMLFSQTGSIALAVTVMLGFAMFLKMANGATYAIVPFVNKRAVGAVSGIVGAGGNVGGVLAGFLFKSESISYGQAFLYIGIAVAVVAMVVAVTRFEKKPVPEPVVEFA
ncbi:MFS transporter [uncultured Spirosoma sp.]|uniref:MFS transporter n=1 Tax=uncultured Spirosoma sp. TaxID=278208 RepID=UPI0025845258|nr:MFS transporter [uncultured Spirosoma sp.]